MAEILSVSIDLTKIDKTKIQTVDKNGNPFKNGAKYYNLQIFVNDDIDQYGNNVGVCDSQTKEQREAKDKKTYLGNGKRVWMSNSQKQSTATVSDAASEVQVKSNEPDGDLPF